MATTRPQPLKLAFDKTHNGRMFDRTVRHSIQLERYKQSLYERLAVGAEVSFDDVLAETRKDLSKIRRASINRVTFDEKRIRYLTSNLLRKNREKLKAGYTAAKNRAAAELRELAITEAEWAREAIKASMPVTIDFAMPSTVKLEALVTQQAAHGKLISEWFDELSAAHHRRIGTTIRSGIAQGHGIEKIVRQTGVDTKVARQQMRAAVRTIATDVSSRARELTYEKSNVVTSIRWVSTLDSRTTDICAGLDGKQFKVGEGIRPPAHMQCRSTTVPVLKSWKAIGIKAKELKPSTRAQMPGSRGAYTEKQNYGDFLRRQDREFQENVLGVERAKMFRSGRVKIDEFVDYNTPKPRSFTIAELRRRAGLDKLPSNN